MSHNIIDLDTHFVVNADDRSITNETGERFVVMQYDHNSERVTFEIPRQIENHDMSLCDLAVVLFTNTGKGTSVSTRSVGSGVYHIRDLVIDEEDDNKLRCSWLISREATQYTGKLKFQLEFICHEDEENGIPEYNWHSDQCDMIDVRPSLNSANDIVEVYPDIMTQFNARVDALEKHGVPQDRLDAAIDEYFLENPIEKLTPEELRTAIEAYFVDHPIDEVTDEEINAAIEQYLKDHAVDNLDDQAVKLIIQDYLADNQISGSVTEEELKNAIEQYFIDHPDATISEEALKTALENYLKDHPIPSGTGSGELPLEYYADMFTTSKKIQKYENGDESDDIFMRFEGANAVWYRGICTGEIETIDNLYWIDENHTALTTQETDYPVEVYIYDEHVRMQVEITNDETHGPKWTFGEGGGYDNPDWGKSFLEKTATTTEFYQVSDSGKKNGIFISNNYTDIVGERMPTKMAWNGNTLNVTYQGDITRTFVFSDDLSTLTVDGHTIYLEGFA